MTDRTAAALASTFGALMPDNGRRALTPDEQADIADVLDAAAAWDAGDLDLNAAAHIGTLLYEGHPSRSYSRAVALIRTPRADPRWHALNRMVDVLATSMYVRTRAGLFSATELHHHDRAVQYLRDHPTKEAA